MDKRILIVEDDTEIRELLGTYLKGQGYDIDYAENGLTADRKITEYLEGRSTESISLILLDIMLPLMSGDQILQKLREKSDVPVIIISA